GWLAEHYFAAGESSKALPFAFAAAEEHAAVWDHHGALSWYERILPFAAVQASTATPGSDERRLLGRVHERLGDMRAVLGDIAGAVECYQSAELAHAEQADDPATESRLACKTADALRRKGEGERAIECLVKVLARPGQKTKSQEASCHLALARVHMYRAEYAAAGEHAAIGLALACAADDPELVVQLAGARADVETYRGDAKAAVAVAEEALAESHSGASEIAVARLYQTHGRACVHAGEYAKAIESLERAAAVHRAAGLVEQEAKVLNNLGAACYLRGDWDKALSACERFLHLCERTSEIQEQVGALNNLGCLYRDRGELAESVAVFDRAMVLADRAFRPYVKAASLGNRGEALFKQGDTARARESYESCLRHFESIDARGDLIETKRRLCELELSLGRSQAAMTIALETAREAKEAGIRLEEGSLHRVAAAALRLEGNLESASWFLNRAKEILDSVGSRYELAKLDLEAAELAAARGQHVEAMAGFDRAIEAFAALGARWDLSQARSRRHAFAGQLVPAAGAASLAQGGLGEVVLEVALASGRMELERLLEVILDRILEASRFERGFILLLDSAGMPTERMRRTSSKEGAEFDQADSYFSGSVVRRVARSGEPVAVTDVAGDAALRMQQSVVSLKLRSIMCVPMRVRDRITGIIYVDSRRLSEKDHSADLVLLEALASQAAIAVENARLVAEEQRKTELMAILAHEIRNPLSGILGFSDPMPEERESLSAPAIGLFARIHRDAQRLKRLVDNVLELVRVEAGKVQWTLIPVAVPELVADVRASYELLAERNRVTIELETAADLPKAVADQDRLFQVLSNLVGNALKFCPQGGRVTIGAHQEQVDASALDGEVGESRQGEGLAAWTPIAPKVGETRRYVRIDVSDTGPGIPKERRSQLFEKFAQGEEGKRSARGIGLGLFISREIVRRHGGTIWVEDAPSGGARFSFRIPVAPSH
ncbi:MAG: ATP-binding protein, partial [Pseudomonadota bacterium]